MSAEHAAASELHDDQQVRLVESLRAAGGGPVDFEELRAMGIEHPAVLCYELEIAGVPIVQTRQQDRRMLALDTIAEQSQAEDVGVRAAPADDTGPLSLAVPARSRLAPVAAAASAGGRVRKVPVAVAAALARVAAAAASIPAGFATARPRAMGRLTAANARRLIAGGSLLIVVAAVAAIVATLGGGGARSGAHRASARPHASPPRTVAQVPRSTPVPAAPAPAAAPPTPAPAAPPAPASTPPATSTTPPPAPSPAHAPTPVPTPPAPAKAVGPLAQLGAAAGHASPAAASELDLEGHQLLGEGRYPAAVDRLLGALRASGESLTRCTQPTSGSCLTFAYALYDLGHALRLSGDAGAAIPILSRRLRINNQRSVVQHELDLARRAGA